MNTETETEEVRPLELECLDQDCPGHVAVPDEPGLHHFLPCDHCPWSYDVSVWPPFGGVTLAFIVARHAPGSSASFEMEL